MNNTTLQSRDLVFGAINGAVFGLMASFVAKNFGYVVNPVVPLITFSLLAVIGIFIGYLLSKIKPFFFQLAKFGAIGAANFSIDFGVYNILIFLTHINTGTGIDVFKGIAFLGAVTNSYFWNKHWSFSKKDSTSSEKEFALFLSVSVVGAILSIGMVHILVNTIGSPSGVSPNAWANLANVGATLIVLMWNFLGYKFIVFKK
jgi:putative flippase GtrA